MRDFYENCDEHICRLSIVTGVIGLVACAIAGFFFLIGMLGGEEDMMVVSLIVIGSGLADFLASLFSYGFGIIIRNSHKSSTPAQPQPAKINNSMPEM